MTRGDAQRTTGPRASRVHGAILVGLLVWIAVGLAAQLHLVLADTLAHSIDVLFDDAYYYLGIAWHLAHDHTSRFTEPLSTNGYHPLWLLMLAGLAMVFDLSKQGLVVAVLVLTALLKCAGLVFFDHRQPDALHRTIGRIAIFVAIVKYPLVFSTGMETTLFVLFIPWLLRLAKTMEAGRGHALRLGALMSIVFLARLDALALDMAVLGMALVTRRLSARQLPWVLLPVVSTMAVYALVNLHFFGTPVPVSGQAKAIGSQFAANVGATRDFLAHPGWVGAMLALWALARLTVAPTLRAGVFELGSLALATVACAVYYGALSGWPIWPWYLYPNAYLGIYAAIAGGMALMAFHDAGVSALRSDRARRACRRGAAALAGVLSVGYLAQVVARETLVDDHLASYFLKRDTRVPERSSFNQQNVAFIAWLTSRYPAGATIVMGDRAGGLGYWMPQRYAMLQVEGLVADKPFLDVLRTGTMPAYAASMGADLYISDRPRQFESHGVLGFIEPVQPRVTRGPLSILCFRQSDQLLSQDYAWGSVAQLRRIFDFRKRVDCPPDMLAQVRALKATYYGLRSYSGF